MKTWLPNYPAGVVLGMNGLSFGGERLRFPGTALDILSLPFFLCLSALYESWTFPSVVLLVFRLVGWCRRRHTVRGLTNDAYFQVGLLVTIGIPRERHSIVEVRQGEFRPRLDSWIGCATRPAAPASHIMTSLAFMCGVRRAISSGAGSGAQHPWARV